MNEKKSKVVTHRAKGDRKPARPIADEPEMKELKRMIRDGELDRDRTLEDLRRQAEDQEPTREEEGKPAALTPGEWTLTIRAGGRTRQTAVRIVHVHRDGYTVDAPGCTREFLFIPKKDIISAKAAGEPAKGGNHAGQSH